MSEINQNGDNREPEIQEKRKRVAPPPKKKSSVVVVVNKENTNSSDSRRKLEMLEQKTRKQPVASPKTGLKKPKNQPVYIEEPEVEIVPKAKKIKPITPVPAIKAESAESAESAEKTKADPVIAAAENAEPKESAAKQAEIKPEKQAEIKSERTREQIQKPRGEQVYAQRGAAPRSGSDARTENRTDTRPPRTPRTGQTGIRPPFTRNAQDTRTRPNAGPGTVRVANSYSSGSGQRHAMPGRGDVPIASASRRFGAPGTKPPAKDGDRRRADDRNKKTAPVDRKGAKKEILDLQNEENMTRAKRVGRFIKPEKQIVEEEKVKTITIKEIITIKELAEKMKIQPSAIVKKFFLQGKVVTVNQEIDFETAEGIAIEYEILCEKEIPVDIIAELLKEDDEIEANLENRPPVVCVMGHVDHGKTSLLDAIRKTNVTDREAGGITQHIGAYTVSINGRSITFLDTPGHEAFTAMRMRGANATDIAILVVAADDGVMPQTIEAIDHAKAAGVEIIVAINKVDKPNANVERVKQELTEHGLISEEWGGSNVFVPVSAKAGTGIENLLEMVLLTADVLELRADPKRQARGLVIEAQLDKGMGPVATVLVQKGTLNNGDFIAAGISHGKVRAMIDGNGNRINSAGPSTPVKILGLNDVPSAGDTFIAPDNDREARQFAATFITKDKENLLKDTKAKMSLDDLYSKIKEGSLKELNIIVKADVQGSVEAVKESLLKLSNEEVIVKIIHGGVGAINESDVALALTSNAIIIGFNTKPDPGARTYSEGGAVDIRLYSVIYKAVEDVEAAMKGMLDPVFEEKVLGHAEVRAIFKASKIGNIAGARVMDGIMRRGCKVRITRAGEQIFEGDLASLKHLKDDVKEVREGFECGLVFEGFDTMQELDMVEAYTMVEVPR